MFYSPQAFASAYYGSVIAPGDCGPAALAQSSPALPKKLPSADKIVDNYLKAIGGKKAAGALKDATYEWTVQLNNQPIGTARTQRKAPCV